MSEYLSLVVAGAIIYAVFAGRLYGHLSAISLFIYAQSAMAMGAIPLLDVNLQADRVHCALILGTLGVLVAVAIVLAHVLGVKAARAYQPQVDYQLPVRSVAFWILLSLTITTWYYSSIGYIALFESLDSIAGGTDADLAALRLESYSGSTYYFPGYVNQFKNSLLPALMLAVVVSSFHFRKGSRWMLLLTLGPATLVALLGTGQRGAFVMAAIIAVVMLSLVAPASTTKYVVRAAFVVLPLFFISTFASGRAASQLKGASDLGDMLGVMFEQLTSRIFGSNQLSSVVGFRYVHQQSIVYGAEWWQSIVGLLPGHAGSDLSNTIFSILYGSTRGTSPVSVWGSAFYNFGFGGALASAGVIAVILVQVSRAGRSGDSTNLVRTAGVAGVTVCLGMWIADGPTTVINTGIVVYIFLWIWGNRRRTKTSAVEQGGVSVEEYAPTMRAYGSPPLQTQRGDLPGFVAPRSWEAKHEST